MRASIVLSLALSLVAGCDKRETKGTVTAPSASAAPVPSATPSPTPTASAAPSAGKMANCPSIIPGANTVVKDVEGGVLVSITAADGAATGDIRARSKFLAEAAKNMTPDVKHTGGGEGGGTFGRCPVVMRNTSVDVKEIEGGAELLVKPKDAKELDWLRRESRERLAEIADPGAKEAGQGKMAHCPSAVDGAKTTVKDLKDGVEVAIVAGDEAAAKSIRERAREVHVAAKLEAAKVTHKGDGSGGGGYGRCPVVLKDTKIVSKEIPGGIAFTVKPDKADGLAELKKETRERAEKFTLASSGADSKK